MRDKYTKELKILQDSLIDMGNLCETSISKACTALEQNDKELALKVIAKDDVIDKKEREIEDMCFNLILHEQPVASDLNCILAILKMVSDIKRIASQSMDIASIVKKSGDIGALFNDDIKAMCNEDIAMLHISIEAFIKKDLTQISYVILRDDFIDGLFYKVKSDLIEKIQRSSNDYGHKILDILMIAKYLERIGDHTCNIASWVNFALCGKHLNQQ